MCNNTPDKIRGIIYSTVIRMKISLAFVVALALQITSTFATYGIGILLNFKSSYDADYPGYFSLPM